MIKNRLNWRCYLVIVRQVSFNPNLDETLLVEDQTKCFGIKVYSSPWIFGGNQLIDARDQVGRSVNLGISWYVSTIYLDIHPLTMEDINRLGSLHFTCKEPHFPHSSFGRSTTQF